MGGKRKNKNGPPLCSEGDKGGGGLTGTRASEAKGPFPGGKRVGSWGKKKRKSKRVGITLKSEEGWELGEEKECKSKRKQKRKPLALAQKMYDDSTSRSHEILAIKVELTLALHPL